MIERKKLFLIFGIGALLIAIMIAVALIPVYLSQSSSTVLGKCVPNPAVDKMSLAPVSLLDGDEFSFNEANKPVRLKLGCSILDVKSYIIFANQELLSNTTNTSDSITVNGLSNGSVVLSLLALDIYGLPIFASFQLYFGNISMVTRISYVNGTNASDVSVSVSLTDNPRISQSRTTDEFGIVTFDNLPSLTISIFAHSRDNQIGLAGIAPTSKGIDLTLIPFSSERRIRQIDSRQTNSVRTSGQSLQTISGTFISATNATEVYVEYQFVTEEVSGGSFGSQLNDYFSVTLRSDKGYYTTKTEGINGLGLGVFILETGAAPWTNLTLSVDPSPQQIRFDVGVANVADTRYQSTVNVGRFGSEQCIDCDPECVQCTSDPMCRETCINPPIKTCSFYVDCMEDKVKCGLDGYALGYGDKYCQRFSNSLNSFSDQGQTWIWTMINCLQKRLVSSLKNCERDCSILRKVAFDSHPICSIQNGICNLTAMDWISTVTVLGNDLFNQNGFIQALKTEPQCIPAILKRIDTALLGTLDKSSTNALQIVRKYLQSL